MRFVGIAKVIILQKSGVNFEQVGDSSAAITQPALEEV